VKASENGNGRGYRRKLSARLKIIWRLARKSELKKKMAASAENRNVSNAAASEISEVTGNEMTSCGAPSMAM